MDIISGAESAVENAAETVEHAAEGAVAAVSSLGSAIAGGATSLFAATKPAAVDAIIELGRIRNSLAHVALSPCLRQAITSVEGAILGLASHIGLE